MDADQWEKKRDALQAKADAAYEHASYLANQLSSVTTAKTARAFRANLSEVIVSLTKVRAAVVELHADAVGAEMFQ